MLKNVDSGNVMTAKVRHEIEWLIEFRHSRAHVDAGR